MLVGFVQEWRWAGDLWVFAGVFGEEAVAWDGELDQYRSLACHGISRRVCRSRLVFPTGTLDGCSPPDVEIGARRVIAD